jgi:hypothetical protein
LLRGWGWPGECREWGHEWGQKAGWKAGRRRWQRRRREEEEEEWAPAVAVEEGWRKEQWPRGEGKSGWSLCPLREGLSQRLELLLKIGRNEGESGEGGERGGGKGQRSEGPPS